MKITKSVFLFFALCAFIWADTPGRFSSYVYYLPISYHGSDYRIQSTVYGIFGDFAFKEAFHTSFEYDRSDFETGFDSTSVHTLQNDFTLLNTYYYSGFWETHFGLHYLTSNDEYSKNTNTVILGLGRYVPFQWSADITCFYTSYPNMSEKPLYVFQATQRFGVSIGDRIQSGFTYESKFHFIHLSHEINSSKVEFYSLEQNIVYYRTRWSAALNLWAGEQMFAVHNNGFLLINFGELYRGSAGITLTVYLSEKTSVTAGYQRIWFSDLNSDNDAQAELLKISVGHSF